MTVTDYSQALTGTYGYLIKIDLQTLLYEKLKTVYAGTPVSGDMEKNALLIYLEDPKCPDVAYNYSGKELTIFFKTAKFPFLETTVFDLFALREAQKAVLDTDYIDVPDKDLQLYLDFIIEEACNLTDQRVPQSVQERIRLNQQIIKG